MTSGHTYSHLLQVQGAEAKLTGQQWSPGQLEVTADVFLNMNISDPVHTVRDSEAIRQALTSGWGKHSPRREKSLRLFFLAAAERTFFAPCTSLNLERSSGKKGLDLY